VAQQERLKASSKRGIQRKACGEEGYVVWGEKVCFQTSAKRRIEVYVVWWEKKASVGKSSRTNGGQAGRTRGESSVEGSKLIHGR